MYFDDMENPVMTARDKTFTWGRIGIGSFDDTGEFDEVRLYGELHRFVPVLAAARGFRIGELVIQHRARKFGRSKYGVSRFVKGFLDLLTVKFLTGFGQRPQHLLGTAGLLAFFAGLFGLTYLAARWLISRLVIMAGLVAIPPGASWEEMVYHLHNRPAVLYSVALLLLGGQLMSVGFLAELFIAYHDPHLKSYSIAEQVGAAEPTGAGPGTDTDAGNSPNGHAKTDQQAGEAGSPA